MAEDTKVGMEKLEQLQLIKTDLTRLMSYWAPRNTQLIQDREVVDIIREKKPTTDKAEWRTNEPKVFFDTSRSLISLNPPRFRLPININYDADEKARMNKAERLAIGIYRTLNMDTVESGGVSWFWDLAYYILLGWWAVFAIVEKTPDGPKFRADIWEPLNVYPEWDRLGLKRCIRSYQVDEITSRSMASDFQESGMEFEYKSPSDGEFPMVVNYWLRTGDEKKPQIWNAITLNGALVKPLTLQRKLRRIPVHIGSVGSPDRTSPGWQVKRGESIIYANRDMYNYRNTIMSLEVDILAATAFPNLVGKTRSGQPAFNAEDVRGHGSQINLKLEDSIELLKHAATPQEAAALDNFIGMKINEGSLSPTVLGNAPFELSGFAISQLTASLKYKLGPYINAGQNTISRMMTDFFTQYKNGNFGKLTLSTENPSDIKRGMTYMEEFSTKDVPERTYVEVEIPITSQFDRTQKILNAKQALTPPQIYSRETIWEWDNDIQDFEVERERIKQDMVEQDPFIIEMEIIGALWSRYEALRVAGKPIAAEALKKYIMMKEMSAGMRKGIPEKPGAFAPPGVSPELMPPEARESPDVLNAITGKPPPSPNRPISGGQITPLTGV